MVVDLGSQDVNGSIRSVCPKGVQYVGLDFIDAPGVDIVLTDPYKLPLQDSSVDIVVSSSCFEHSEMFWVVFIEILRILKPGGLFYLNVPTSGSFHQYPVDCWRFYPDSGKALVSWGKRNNCEVELLESYTQVGGMWQDFVAVFVKGNHENVRDYPTRIIDNKVDYENGYVFGDEKCRNFQNTTQDQRVLSSAVGKLAKKFHRLFLTSN